MNTILWALIAIVVVAAITEATRRSPFWLALLLLLGAPLAIIIYVIPAMASFSFFTIIKLMSVMAGSLYGIDISVHPGTVLERNARNWLCNSGNKCCRGWRDGLVPG
jgi:hypothetical protein